MGFTGPLDFLPLLLLFVVTVVISLLSLEGGFRLGDYRRHHRQREKETALAELGGAMLGLLAFLLAFTFGLAASRFDARRLVVIDEANAIGTCYLRAGFLPESHQTKARELLREYVDLRLEAVSSGDVMSGVNRSAALHAPLWAEATAAVAEDPRSIPDGLFVESLNDVIDLHTKRVTFGLRSRIPLVIWGALYALEVLAFLVVGYHAGLSGARDWLAVVALALAFSAVMMLIADLDRPHEGMLKVSQQAMIDLRASFATSSP